MGLLIYRCYKKEGFKKRKVRSLSVYQKMTSSSEIKYLEMLNRGYKKLAIRKFKIQQYVKTRSAKLVEEMDCCNNKNDISTAIIN